MLLKIRQVRFLEQLMQMASRVIENNVREIVDKKVFEKGYTSFWSKEIYIIRSRLPTNPLTYQIKALDGKEYDWDILE